MARITVEDCIDKFESRFELVLVASNRARKLHSGENPTVEKDNDKNTVLALREIADETMSVDVLKDKLIQEYQTVSLQDEEDLTLEYSNSEIEESEESSDESEESSKEKENYIENSEDLNSLDKQVENNQELEIDDIIIDSNESENS